MWILPADLSGLHVELTEGTHLLPWHYVEEEVDRLAWLLRLTLKGIDGEVRLDDATLRVLSDRKVTAPTSLVVVVVRETSPGLDEIMERVKALGARSALLQFPEPQEMGYGWLEREVKAPLYRAIGAWVKRADHPLAALNVQALPVMEAAALTTDPVELIEILERALSHRLRHADVGCEEEDYHRSLLLAAGKRLADRLKRLDEGTLAGDGNPLRQALEVLVSRGDEVEDRERHRHGARALDRVGLARYSSGELSFGPLARQATTTLALGALESELPRHAWSDPARAKIGAILRAQAAVPPAILLGVRGESAPVMVEVSPPFGLLEKPVAQAFPTRLEATEAVSSLREIAALPAHCIELPSALQDRLVRHLRWLHDVVNGSNISERVVGQVLDGLLRLWSARGADALSQQEVAWKRLEDAVRQGSEPWVEQAVAAAGLRSAELLVRYPRAREDLDRADELVQRHLNLARRSGSDDAALNVAAYLCLAEIAIRRGDNERAHDCADKAVQGARRTDQAGALASSLFTLARVNVEQERYLEAEQCAREALRLYEAMGEPARIGATLRVVAFTLLLRHEHGRADYRRKRADRSEAAALSERSLAVAEAIGDLEGQAESLVVRVMIGADEGQDDRVREMALRATALADATGSPFLRAEAYVAVAFSFLQRQDRDQAMDWVRRSVAIYETLGVQSNDANALREVLANETKR